MPQSKKWKIPQRFDEPKRILFFSALELGVILLFVFGGLLLSEILIGAFLAGAAVMFMRQFGKLLHGYSPAVLAYWFLGIGSNKQMLPSWKRHWRG